jgi:hypothetical protein
MWPRRRTGQELVVSAVLPRRPDSAPAPPPPASGARTDPDEMVWQLAEKRAADLADARRALVEAETTIGQLEAYLGAVRQINVRLNAQAARARRQRDEMQVHLGHALARLAAVRRLHTDSVAGVCPSCGRISDVSDTDDGLVAWPCPTIVALDLTTARMADAGGGQ